MKNIRILFLFTLSFLSLNFYGQSINTILLDDDFVEHILYGNDLEVYEDRDKKHTLESILSDSIQAKFTLNPDYAPKNERLKSAYWVRFRLLNKHSNNKSWLFECYDQTIDNIQAYFPIGNGVYQKVEAGDSFEFSSREIKHKNFEFEGNSLKSGNPEYYYFRFEADHPITMIIAIRSINKFIYYGLNEYLCFGLFYGMILIISFYNLLMYFAIKKTQYLFYVSYVLCIGVYFASTDGIAYQYLWPNFPEWNQVAYGVAVYCAIILALFFTRSFLNTKIHYPLLDKIIIGVMIFRTVYFFVALLFYQVLFDFRIVEIIPLIAASFAGIYSFTNGYSPARFFVVSYVFLLIGFFIKIMVFLEIVPFGIITHYSFHICFVFEMIFLSFALADKVKILKDRKERAQKKIIEQYAINTALKDKVNRELEEKVQSRTMEIQDKNKLLEQANIQLKIQAEEINRMNLSLDVDNSNLRKNIQEVMVSRVMKQNIDYEEFKKIFPDELSCLRYLNEVKWKDVFTCKKCRNDKYFDGAQLFARRCTRCGYNESLTANTIFQGVKFPIEKAFYITYIVITEREDITLEQLSEMLELRRNTCWSFKKKLLKIIDKEKAGRARAALKNWGHVVFYHEEN